MRWMLTFPLIVALASCGSGGGGGEPDAAGDAGVDPGAGDLIDGLVDDVGTDLGTSDAATDQSGMDLKPETLVVFPLTLDLACEGDGACKTSCGNGTCVGGICEVKPLPGHCMESGDTTDATCYQDGQHSGKTPCLFCNAKVTRDRLVPFAIEEDFEAVPLTFPPVVVDETGGGVSWTVTQQRAKWGAASLYFGIPGEWTYGNGQHVGARATFNGLDVPDSPGVFLSFFLFMDTEQTEGYDFLRVEVISGGDTAQVFNSDSIVGTTQGVFLPVKVALEAFRGQTVDVAFSFDSVDGGINSYEGVYVDGVRVGSGCCSVAHDCDDGDPCTEDSCPGIGESCLVTPKADCCVVDTDCSDDDTCTQDWCPVPGEACSFDHVAGCCHADADCDDGDACTLDSCPEDGGQCLHLPGCCDTVEDCESPVWCLVAACVDGKCSYDDQCCHSDADCDDLDPCTNDKCEEGDCVYKVANIPGCCWPDVLLVGFDSGPAGFTMDAAVNGVGWSIVNDGKSVSPPGALYYGDPSSKDYDNGSINTGTAVSPTIDIPAGYGAGIAFHLYLDTESSASYDKLIVKWLEGEDEWVLWTKDSYVTQNAFTVITVNMSAFAGRSGKLAFTFDTVDSTINYGEGVYVDDLAVTSTCEPVPCSGDSDCGDGLLFTDDTCSAGACSWVVQDPGSGIECSSDWDCDDFDWCTYDYCVSGKCIYEWDPWCF